MKLLEYIVIFYIHSMIFSNVIFSGTMNLIPTIVNTIIPNNEIN